MPRARTHTKTIKLTLKRLLRPEFRNLRPYFLYLARTGSLFRLHASLLINLTLNQNAQATLPAPGYAMQAFNKKIQMLYISNADLENTQTDITAYQRCFEEHIRPILPYEINGQNFGQLLENNAASMWVNAMNNVNTNIYRMMVRLLNVILARNGRRLFNRIFGARRRRDLEDLIDQTEVFDDVEDNDANIGRDEIPDNFDWNDVPANLGRLGFAEIVRFFRRKLPDFEFGTVRSAGSRIKAWAWAPKFEFFRWLRKQLQLKGRKSPQLFPLSSTRVKYVKVDAKLMKTVIGLTKSKSLKRHVNSSSDKKNKLYPFNMVFDLKRIRRKKGNVSEFAFYTDGYGASVADSIDDWNTPTDFTFAKNGSITRRTFIFILIYKSPRRVC